MKKFNSHFEKMLREPWAIMEDRLRSVRTFLETNRAKLTVELEVDPKAQAGPVRLVRPASMVRVGSVAVLPITGVITQRVSAFMEDFFGMVGTDNMAAALREAAADESITTIVLDIDSPGGTSAGVQELAAEIMEVRKDKKVVAVANSLAASAAFWIAAAATELVATPSAMVGSIGVFLIHEDITEMLKNEGIKETIIRAGKFKIEANPFEPLTDEARAHLQGLVDTTFKAFVKDVAAGRGVTPGAVRENFGEGRVVMAQEALAAGMVDRVATMNDTMIRLLRRDRSRSMGAKVLDSIRSFECFLRDEGNLSHSVAKRIASHGFSASRDSGKETPQVAESKVLDEIKSLAAVVKASSNKEET